MSRPCACTRIDHPPRLVVVTGGPGAGKTALLEVAQRSLCRHVAVLPEAASILWTGGFPRRASLAARAGAQRAIVRVQRELERIAIEELRPALVLCDRGSLDGLAYWPDTPERFFEDLGTTREAELARYAAVIHLRPPADGHGYPGAGPIRVESASEAAAIDDRIVAAWANHPRRAFIASSDDFLTKIRRALELVRVELPPCCGGPAENR